MSIKRIVVICIACAALTGCAGQPVKADLTTVPTVAAALPTAQPSRATPAPAPQATQLASPAPESSATLTADLAIWGAEVTLDEFIALAQSGKVSSIEWFVPYDRVRINTITGPRYNYKNTTQVDMVKVLEDHGVVIGDEGVPLSYET